MLVSWAAFPAPPAAPMPGPRQRGVGRPAFALVDLLALVGAAALFLAIYLPAAVKARQSARDLASIDGQRNAAAAVFRYQASADAFPAAGKPGFLIGRDEMPALDSRSSAFPAFATRAADNDNWAAIAYSFKTGRYGYSFNYATEEEARRQAIKHCAAEDAEVLAVVGNGCAALAVGDNNGWGVGLMRTREEAEKRALKECEKRTKNCKLVCWTCND